ncbi:MAG: Trk system potassium uptake protein TrkH [Synergistetes bacterium ADurb.BinA166]|nr:MAG: Trk system potassium uptake protein TrkH [Synergistetes bacterium ADurb.BinA166]
MNPWLVAKVLSLITTIVSLSMLWPLAWAWRDGSGDDAAIIQSMLLGLCASGLLYAAGRRHRGYGRVSAKDAFAVVSLSWVAASAVGALPYYLHGMVPTFGDAFFEAMSGFTTTGASILPDIEAHPRGLLFWRGLTHWVGGMGIIVLGLAVLPFLGVGGINLFRAEVPGFAVEKMTPRLHQMALRMWGIYVLMTVAAAALLFAGGMDSFDSLSHAFSTIATGGLSPLNRSIGHYNSAYIDWVVTFFMFFSGVNFALHYRMLLGDAKAYGADPEFRTYLGIVLLSTAGVAAVLYRNGLYATIGESVRYAAFQVVSVITSTGFSTADYNLWPPFAHAVFIFLMFAGGSSGSTAGGLKCIRVLALARRLQAGLSTVRHPRGVFQARIGGRIVSHEAMSSVTAFFVLYMLAFVLGALFMAWLGLDLVTAFSSAAAALGNTGPGLGAVGPAENFSAVPMAGKWMLSFLMLLGRLELYTLILIFVPDTWRR